MTIAPQDSALFRDLFADPEIARLFSDSATIRAMLIVMGTLAKVQGERGTIPAEAGAYLHRAALEVQIDPSALAAETARNGVCIPALVAAFARDAQVPDHTRYLHWGATSQDVTDTGLALRLRQVLSIAGDRLDALLAMLADLAEAHAERPMAARTYGQIATPTTFGATAAIWGSGILSLRDELPAIRDAVEIVTLNGASGTLSVLGEDGPGTRTALARALGLRDPGISPHADRSHILALAGWANRVLAACAKMATDLTLLTRDGDIALGGGGASSTMPQKANPVGPSTIRALALYGNGLATAIHAGVPWDQRDGGAWFAEWLSLPPLLAATVKALSILGACDIQPDADRMASRVEDPSGLIHAEALSFALARDMPRPDAQAQVKTWAAEVRAKGGSLLDRAGADPADYAPDRQWGEAPALARRFAAKARGRGNGDSLGNNPG
ncbi:MAG: lyase family protein [Jannaschia sp.]